MLARVKEKVTSTPILTFYDPAKELTIQVDSSKDRIGAALLQDGKPMTNTEGMQVRPNKKRMSRCGVWTQKF